MADRSDEPVTTGLQRKRTTHEILTDLLRAEAAHRHAASIRYRMTAAKLPVIKDLDAFVFDGTPIKEGLVRSLHARSFVPGRRDIVLIVGTGTGKTHLSGLLMQRSAAAPRGSPHQQGQHNGRSAQSVLITRSRPVILFADAV